MKTKTMKLTGILLSVVMLVTMLGAFSLTAFAADGDACTTTEGCTGTYTNGFCSVCEGYEPATGSGTADDPYKIGNAGQLYWFAAHVNAGNTSVNAKLTASIDLNKGYIFTFIPDTGLVEVTKDGAAVAYLGTGMKGAAVENGNTQFDTTASAAGTVYTLSEGTYTENATALDALSVWTSIGNSDNNYTGIFDGNGKKVSGIYINNSNDNQGLFGYVGTSGTVKNLGVENSYVKGNGFVGGVVGYSEGIISNCSNTGTVIGGGAVGGVAGLNYSGNISNSYNTGTVIGKSAVGGVAGENDGSISNSYNTGAVSGTSNNVGGVAGLNYSGNISNSYNTGTVSGTRFVGGVAGTK